jgi:pyruvate carboxylase
VCYTGDITDPQKGKYNLEYYLDFVRQLNELGIHVLAIKDMVRFITTLDSLKLICMCPSD